MLGRHRTMKREIRMVAAVPPSFQNEPSIILLSPDSQPASRNKVSRRERRTGHSSCLLEKPPHRTPYNQIGATGSRRQNKQGHSPKTADKARTEKSSSSAFEGSGDVFMPKYRHKVFEHNFVLKRQPKLSAPQGSVLAHLNLCQFASHHHDLLNVAAAITWHEESNSYDGLE
ncbi:unnamed protein product [Ectocarpus sp. 13 AM-2016]